MYQKNIYQKYIIILKDNKVLTDETLDYSTFKLNFHANKYLDVIIEIEKNTEINHNTIDVTDKTLIETIDANTKWIMKNEGQQYKNIISKLKPKTFEDIIKIVALLYGTDLWNNIETLGDKLYIKELLLK